MKAVSNDEDMSLLPMNANYNEDIEAYSEANLNSVSNDEDIEGYSEDDTVNFRNILRTSNKDLNININSNSKEHRVTITGNVADKKGEIKPGTIQIEIPTTALFTVDKDGNFTAADIKIKNNGQEAVDIYAYKFVDTNGPSGINIESETSITENRTDKRRNNISLNIVGTKATAYFKSESLGSNKLGVYEDQNLEQETTNGIKVLKIYGDSTGNLTFNGKAGKAALETDTAIRDRFTLILKIKKSTN